MKTLSGDVRSGQHGQSGGSRRGGRAGEGRVSGAHQGAVQRGDRVGHLAARSRATRASSGHRGVPPSEAGGRCGHREVVSQANWHKREGSGKETDRRERRGAGDLSI